MAQKSVVEKTPDVRTTDKDYQALRAALIADWKRRFPGISFDFSSPNYITLLTELIAYLGDQIHYNIDVAAREAFITTAKLAENVQRHATMLGFQPASRVATTAKVTLTLAADTAFPINIPSGTKFFTADGENSISFQTLRDETIPAGNAGDSITIFVENSRDFTETFQTSGDPNQEFLTTNQPILLSGIDGTGAAEDAILTLEVDGLSYTKVDTFDTSEPTDRHFLRRLTNGGRLLLRFGDGTQGVAPDGVATLSGRTGGGAGGNNATVTQGPTFINTNGEVIDVTISQSVVSAGGADPATLEEIKIQAPLSLQSNLRTVSETDFRANAEVVAGVDRALPLTNDDDASIPLNTTEVVILTSSPVNGQIVGGNAASVSTTVDVDDDFNISINGETPQLVEIGTQSDGASIAAAIEAAVRAMTPEFPLDNSDAYTNFTATFDATDVKYTLTTGDARLASSITITAGPNDASVNLKIDTNSQQDVTLGVESSAAAIAGVNTSLTSTNPTLITHKIDVQSPTAKIINHDFEVRFGPSANTAALKVAVRDKIRSAIQDFYAPRLSNGQANPEIDFGRTVRFSDLISVVNGVDGIESVDEDSFVPADDVTLTQREFPVIGGVKVRDDSTGNPV